MLHEAESLLQTASSLGRTVGELNALLDEALEMRDKIVVQLVNDYRYTGKEVGFALGVSQQRVSQIIKESKCAL